MAEPDQPPRSVRVATFLAPPTIIVWQLLTPSTVEWLATNREAHPRSEARQ